MKMKKLSKAILLALSILFTLKAKAQIIPNEDFENWTLLSGVNSPDSWQTTAAQPSDTISPKQVTDNANGNYAILFQTRYVNFGAGISEAYASINMPLLNKPLYFNGYYKSLRTGLGAAEIKATLKNNGIVIGTSLLTVNTNLNSYTTFSLPINYSSPLVPDEVTIYIASDGTMNKLLNNKLWVDNLSFTNSPLSTNEELFEINNISIYPNPAKNILNIDLKNNEKGTIKIMNTFGQIILEKQIALGKSTLEIEFLTTGIYLLVATTENKKRTLKFIKE